MDWTQIFDILKFVVPIVCGGILAFYRYSVKIRADLDKQSNKLDQLDERVTTENAAMNKRIDHTEISQSAITTQLNQISVMLARLEERIQLFLDRRDK